MASVIKAGNATDGVQVTSDNTGILELKTGTGSGTTAMTVGTDQAVIFAKSSLASYQWTSWSPTNLTGTVTNAPSTGTTDDSNYVTMSNSSGTLTVTFDVAGTYLVCVEMLTFHSNVYTYDTFYANLGGTATRRIGRDDLNNWGEPANDSNFSITTSFYVSATAGQTLTIQPQYRLSGGGTTGQHIAYCNATFQYCGG